MVFRYLRDYIETGHNKKQLQLSESTTKTLDFIDNYFLRRKNQKIIKLKRNELILFNNHFLFMEERPM